MKLQEKKELARQFTNEVIRKTKLDNTQEEIIFEVLLCAIKTANAWDKPKINKS